MIQPLTSHRQLESPFASGYVEENSRLIVNGEEVTYDETGYFYVENFGKELTIELTSESGNQVEYTWQPTAEETGTGSGVRSEEHTSELQSRGHLVCRLLLEKKK